MIESCGYCKPTHSPNRTLAITKRRRLDEYTANKENNNYTDGLKMCTRCRHRAVIINTTTCLNGDCDKEKKKEQLLKKRTRKAAATPQATAIKCTGEGNSRGCGCKVFVLPGKHVSFVMFVFPCFKYCQCMSV